ncbi:uncharacterized protein CLUP02_08354 [Colletotrichum lupini]|uniref:Uncharacterized protein n=1 Tax=Colletotrichum lupini TaxID=145971 RepID=A0A9Q8SSQ9_9PEZI|nr:uncharacterized protein CLUP02_08354 [Colletotrichum lupini]UQC82864.1 hypothetical protein CLUP02_08354 [Colletotrichum lupini]
MVFVLSGVPEYVASDLSDLRCVLFLGTLDAIPGPGYNLSKLPAISSDTMKL